MSQHPIVVIGAGLAGLVAARALHRSGRDVVVFEARDRIGGRILTVDAAGATSADGFDLGPSWFWPDTQPAIGALVAELGLASFVQHGAGDVVFERMSREPPMRYQGMAQAPHSYRLVGGTGALLHALAAALPAGSVRLGVTIRTIERTDEGVALTIASAGAESERLVADQVVAALPPRLLAATMTLTPAPAATTLARWRETPTWMAPHAKFFALYDRPFWREDGFSGTAQSMVGPLAEIHDATTADGAAALFGFVGVPAAQRARLGDATLTEACVAQLGRLFGAAATAPHATLLKDWAADPLTATTDDHAAAGHPEPRAGVWVDGSWAGRLHLAGSETSPTDPGYLAGAVVAAQRAVGAVLDSVPRA